MKNAAVLSLLLVVLALSVNAQTEPGKPVPVVSFVKPKSNSVQGFKVEVELSLENFEIPKDGLVALYVNNALFGHINSTEPIVFDARSEGDYRLHASAIGSVGDTSLALSHLAYVRFSVVSPGAGVAVSEADGKKITLTNPRQDDIVAQSLGTNVDFELEGWTLPDDGFIGLAVDGEVSLVSKVENLRLTNMTTGNHNLQILLVDKEKKLVRPHGVSVNFTVTADEDTPRVNIQPLAETYGTKDTFNMTFALENFRVPEDGFLHLAMDGKGFEFLETSDAIPVRIQEPGEHTITLTPVTQGRRRVGFSSSVKVNIEQSSPNMTEAGDGSIFLVSPITQSSYFVGDSLRIVFGAMPNLTIPETGKFILMADGQQPMAVFNSSEMVVGNWTEGTHDVTVVLVDTETNVVLGHSPRVSFTYVQPGSVPTAQWTTEVGKIFTDGVADLQWTVDMAGLEEDEHMCFVEVDFEGRSFNPLNQTRAAFFHLAAGNHTARLQLATKERQRIGAPSQIINFAVQPDKEAHPSVQINSPKTGSSFQAGQIAIYFNTLKFAVPDEGFIYLMVDGQGVSFYESNDGVAILNMSNAAAGNHTIAMLLTDKDKNRVGVPSELVEISLTEKSNGDIELHSPISGAFFRADDLRVNFTLAEHVKVPDDYKLRVTLNGEVVNELEKAQTFKLLDVEPGLQSLLLELVDTETGDVSEDSRVYSNFVVIPEEQIQEMEAEHASLKEEL